MTQVRTFDRVKLTSTTTGTGDLSVSGVTGFRSLNDVNGYFYYVVENPSNGEWEIGIGSEGIGGVLQRHTILDNSSATTSAIDFAAGTKNIFIAVLSAKFAPVNTGLCEGRLTLTSATPVTTSDVTGATTVYFTPHMGNQIALMKVYNSGLGYEHWVTYEFSETSLALGTVTSGLPYDIFGYLDSSNVFTLEKTAWTNTTTRASAISLFSGTYAKTSDPTRRYLGTIYTTSTTTTEDSATKRFVWNANNRVSKYLRKTESTGTWNYSTGSYRQANGSTSNQVEIVSGLAFATVDLKVYMEGLATGGGTGVEIGIGEDSTTSPVAEQMGGKFSVFPSVTDTGCCFMNKIPAIGYHKYCWLENGGGSGGVTVTWISNGTRGNGIQGTWEC